MTDLADRKRELERQRDALADRLRRINLDYRRGLDPNPDEQALQLENAEVLEEIGRVTAEELARIEAAILRIEEAIRRQPPSP
ncbi:MAG: hypothetical protein JJT90_06190 [Ectothiorhodospiraceae bacterium]|nr:hypothetical protein [Ectothiorhodospiraceae bacterium]